tara:strand:+ start:67 stop:297 length:231 start_codon:yes stop_codon:yes gene_type:complete
MSEILIWTTSWCTPCGALKAWIESKHYKGIVFKDADKEKPRIKLGQTIDAYPTLQFGDELVAGLLPIQQWLVAHYE